MFAMATVFNLHCYTFNIQKRFGTVIQTEYKKNAAAPENGGCFHHCGGVMG